MPNIKLHYLYRDAANYKNHGFVILANPDNYSLTEIEELIKTELIDHQWFSSKEWGVPDLHFNHWTADDHGWHEFESVEFTGEASTTELPFRQPPSHPKPD